MSEKPFLRRLDTVWVERPIYFITTCTDKRRKILAAAEVHEILVEVWREAQMRYRWSVGRYVVMPDHVHFFCASEADGTSLSMFVGKWKEWTAKYGARRLGLASRLWLTRFFDHVLRTAESYSAKWEYVRENPVRAGLVQHADDWPWKSEITEWPWAM